MSSASPGATLQDEQLIKCAESMLKQINATAPVSIRFVIEAMNNGLKNSHPEGFA